MEMEKVKVCPWLALFMVWALLLACGCIAQDTSCLGQLAPCLRYLNQKGGRSDPPSSCCDPLKSMIESNPQCLCSMISSRASSQASQAGINITEAQDLPGKCGQTVNPIACLAGSPSRPGGNDNNGGAVGNGGSSKFGMWRVDMMVVLVSVVMSATLQFIWA